jgi:hypothetical protein
VVLKQAPERRVEGCLLLFFPQLRLIKAALFSLSPHRNMFDFLFAFE